MRSVLVLLALTVAGCAGTPQADRLLASDHDQAGVELAGVPFFPQREYQCGPAALAMALNFAGVSLAPDALVPEVYLPARHGSLQVEMVAAVRRRGLVPYIIRPELPALQAEIRAGHPIIVLQNEGLSWYPVWHYAVVVGFDAGMHEIIQRSGLQARERVPLRLFERVWRRGGYWGLVVLRAGELPAMADEATYFRSVVGLEHLNWSAAASAYAAGVVRWPDSLVGNIGLGNSLYALGDYAGSEQAFRAAIRHHPEAGAAFNNLAQVLADEGRFVEAEEAAHRAVVLGGPDAQLYRQTLAEIARRRGD